ncbi:MAG: phosphatidate cytidylyltransferase [Chloroflexi bacterium]|nr:phosphatidate cytidylyltransferase [Chloroflexota bacterium]
MLKARILSAAVGIPIVIGAIFIGTSAVGILIILASIIAGMEIAQMSTPRVGNINVFTAVIPFSMAVAGILIGLGSGEWWLLAVVFGAAGFTAITFEAMRIIRSRTSILAIIAAGYFGLLLAHGAPLRSLDDTFDWLLTAILVTFATDTVSYFVGTWLGSHRLFPLVSPSKTWEGALAGIIGGTGAGAGLTILLELPIETSEGALIGLIASLAAVFGDLIESGFKRLSRVKDSGNIIPGHGGVLDRIDSLAPSLAVVYWMALWLTP